MIATAPRAVPPPAGTPLPRGVDLPYSDGEPMDSPWHRDAIQLLLESLAAHRRGRDDYYAGGDMFFYFAADMVRNHDFRGPDFFVVNGVPRTPHRRSWVAWEEGWRLPNVIVELASPTTAAIDRGAKRALYTDRLGIPEYVIADPDGWRLEGWRRYNGTAEVMELEDGRVWLRELEAYLGFWTGEYRGYLDTWPRLFDMRGNLIPTRFEEERMNAEAEKATTRRVLAQLEEAVALTRQAVAEVQAERIARAQEKARADTLETELARLKADLAARGGTP